MSKNIVYFCKDVPKELIGLIAKIDFQAIPEAQRQPYLEQLQSVAQKYLSRRAAGWKATVGVEIDMPQSLADIVNQYDFSKVGKMQIAFVMPFVKGKMKELNIPLRRK